MIPRSVALLGVTLVACGAPHPRTSALDAPSSDAGATPRGDAALPIPSSVSSTSNAPSFPPAPFEVVVSARNVGFKADCFTVVSSRAADYSILVGACGDGDSLSKPDHAAPLLRIRGGACEALSSQSRTWPTFGVLDLNTEPDRQFGIRRVPVEIPSLNDHAGSRLPVALDTEGASPTWVVATRREPGWTWRMASELYRWSSSRWSRVAHSPLGVEWRFAVTFHGGVLAVATDARDWDGYTRGRWSFTPLGVAKGIATPTFARRADESVCAARVLAFEGFASGALISVGATCDGQLLVERWVDGARDSTTRVLPAINVGVLDAWPVEGIGGGRVDTLDVPVEILGETRLRARTTEGAVFDLGLDPASGDWSSRPSTRKLAADRVRDAFAPFSDEFRVQRVYVSQSGALYVSGTHWIAHSSESPKTLLLRNVPTASPCSL